MPTRNAAVTDIAPRLAQRTAVHLDDDKALSLEEAADILGIKPSTLRRWAARGDIEFMRIGKSLKFTRAGLRRYMARHTTVPHD